MFEPSELALYLGAAIVLVITPGPDMMFVLATSMGRGARAGVRSALGVSTGVLVHTLAAALGLAVILQTSAEAYTLIKYAGGVYLVYLGIEAWRHPITPEYDGTGRTGRYFLRGMMSNVLNPKVALFFITFLPQFASGEGATLQMVTLGIIYALLAAGFKSSVALASGGVSRWIAHSPGAVRWLGRAMGGVFIFLGLRLAFTEP